MKNARIYIILSVSGLALLSAALYIFLIRPYVSLAYEGDAPLWFQELVDFLYPRFQIEKQRFELNFFLHKADQILIRSLLLTSGLSLLLWVQSPEKLLEKNLKLHSQSFYNVLTTIFYLGLLYFTWHWIFAFEQMVRMQAFYRGVLLYRILHLPILPLTLYYTLYWLYLLSIVLVLLRYHMVLFSSIAALILLLFQGYMLSFEKIDHGQTTLLYATLLMPALLYELKCQKQNSGQSLKSSWTLFLIQLTIAAVYLLAGLEKLLSSGLEWATAETFRNYIALHNQPLGMKIAQHDFLAHMLPWAALLFQLGFVLILFQGRSKYLFLVAGVFFHWGTKILMDIGPYFSSWFFVYIFFIDWEVCVERWDKWITSRQRKTQKGA